MAGRLEGKRAVVVGAGQTPGETIGNGRAIALLFAREGASVLCVDRHFDRAEETVTLIAAEDGTAHALAADIRQADAGDAIVTAAQAQLGGLDILVNNVGIGGGGDGPAHRLTEDAFERILDVNLKGLWRVTRAALPLLREQGSGSIVNISSLAAIAGGSQLAYEVSKAGVNRLTISVAQANAGKGVRCNAVAPGLMDTPMAVAGIAGMTGQSIEDVRSSRSARVPLGGAMGTAWDTAYAALYLASDEARFVTGVVLAIDGGMSTRIG